MGSETTRAEGVGVAGEGSRRAHEGDGDPAAPVDAAAAAGRAMLGATRVKADQMPPTTLTAASLSASFLRGGGGHTCWV